MSNNDSFHSLSESVRRLDPSVIIGANSLQEMRRLQAIKTRLLKQRDDAEDRAESSSAKKYRALAERFGEVTGQIGALRNRLGAALKADTIYWRTLTTRDRALFEQPGTLEGVESLADAQARLDRLKGQFGAWSEYEDWRELSPGERSQRLVMMLFERNAALADQVMALSDRIAALEKGA